MPGTLAIACATWSATLARTVGILGAQVDDDRLAAADHVADHIVQQLMGIEADPRHLVGDLGS